MCKYCETSNHSYRNEITGEIEDSIYSDSIKIESKEISIIGPTPVSRRKHKDDGLIATLLVCDEFFNVDYIPIKYCPFCGREIK